MFQTLINAFKNKEVRKKILFTLLLLFIYRLGCWLPIPGINANVYDTGGINSGNILDLLSMITGNALQNGAFLAIGISPYINASIIMQLLSVAIPPLEKLTKQGDEGKRKISTITRFVTLGLAIAQAIGIVISFNNSGAISTNIFSANVPAWVICIFVGAILIGGSMFTMWLGERITEVGVGNGISLLIFVGIIAYTGISIIAVFEAWFGGDVLAPWSLLVFVVLVVAIFMFIVFIDLSERKIPVHYAKQIKGRKQYGGQTTFIPIKVNASGVLPIIFSTALLSFPQLIMSLFFTDPGNVPAFYTWWMNWVGVGKPIYSVILGVLILFFSFFYAQIQFNPEEVARNIQQYGGNITGLRPGKQTSDYLKKINKRLTLFGAIFLAIIAIVPSIIFSFAFQTGAASSLMNAFSATGMLIVVSVALEFEKQLQSQLMMKQYRGFLK